MTEFRENRSVMVACVHHIRTSHVFCLICVKCGVRDLNLLLLIWQGPSRCVVVNMCILPSKTQHMYINTVMKYQLHQGYMFRL